MSIEKSYKTILLWLILSNLLLFSYENSIGQAYIIQTDTVEYHDLSPYIKILKDSEPPYTLEQIQSPTIASQFVPLMDIADSFEEHIFYWGRVRVKNGLTDLQSPVYWAFELNQSMTYLDFYLPKSDSTYHEIRTGISRKMTESNYDILTESVNAFIPVGAEYTFYFKMKCEQKNCAFDPTFILKNRIERLQEQIHTNHNMFVFIGFFLMMLVYSFILFLYLKDKAYLYYGIYVSSILFYVLYTTGISRYILLDTGWIDNPEYLFLLRTSIYIVSITYILFMRQFLEMNITFPKWDKTFKIILYIGTAIFLFDNAYLLYSNFNRDLSNQLLFIYIIIATVSILIFLIPLYRTGEKKGLFLIVGLLTVCTTGIIGGILFLKNQEDFDFLYTAILGFVIEVIVFSIGLAYRQKEIQSQRQEANLALTRSQLIQEKKEAEALRLKELNNLKSKLYTNITHEFRTPLTVIEGMTKEIEGNTQKKRMILRNSQNLLYLVNQMLDLSKLESGQMPIQYEQADIIAYLQYIIESFQSYAKSNGIRLHFLSEEEQLLMDFDVDKLLKILSNLLSNAIKFTPDGNDIYVKAALVGTQFKVSVQDKGVGIAADELDSIFDRFYQASHSTIRKKEGTGIGLALTKELVELLGGSIHVKSTEGKGSIFSFLLPVQNIATRSQIQKDSIAPPIPISKNLPKQKNTTLDQDKPIALVIEDNEDVAYYLESCLQENYQTIIAENGRLGIEKATSVIPDIIISDVMMPEADGYEVCSTLKQDERTSHIPIILLTAKADRDSKIFGLERGADAYLSKPFDREELEVRLQKLIEVRKALQIRYSTSDFQLSNPSKKSSANQEDAFLEKIHQIILDNIEDEDFDTNRLCRALGLSRSQLFRKLKALTGTSTANYIRKVRLKKANDLLHSTQKTVSEIAYDVGFKDLAYFSKCFSEEFGIPPSATRK